MSSVIGIDPSLSGFALAVGQPGATVKLYEHKTRKRDGLRGRMARIGELVAHAMAACRDFQADLVLIEGYSYGSKGNAKDMVELGAIVRWELMTEGPLILEVSPTRLKKWATGKGNASKPAVVSALSHRYQREFRSDNEADAFALAMLGLAATGRANVGTKWQREVATQVAEQIREVRSAA